jgi:hypothetical protein
MINEKQAEFLISECELWLDTELGRLRTSLRADHEHTTSILWELIVLHATAASVNSRYGEKANCSRSLASLIQHEPTDAAPDIFLHTDDCQPFYIEVAHIQPRNQQQEDDVQHFPRWIRKKLFQKGISYANSLRIRLDPADSSRDVQVPPHNCWKKQMKTDKWKSFVAMISSQNLPAIWLPEEANAVVKVELGESSSFPVQNVSKQVEDHPIYKTIESKADQAKNWKRAEKKYQPLVLVIGASASLHQINSLDISSVQPQKAVYSALADAEQLDFVTRLNLTDNRSWPWAMRNQRVNGSKLISAVVIVTVRNEYCGGRYERKASKSLIIKNPHPNFALTVEQEWFLEQISS